MKKLLFRNKYLILLIFILTINKYGISENTFLLNKTFKNKNDTVKYFFPKNYIYLELGGSCLYYSLNYERSIFSKKNNNISFRVGVSNLNIAYFKFKSFAFVLNYNRFILKNLLLNFGYGINYWEYSDSGFSTYTTSNSIIYSTTLGINYISKYFFLKASPYVFVKNNSIAFWFGASVGIKFGKY